MTTFYKLVFILLFSKAIVVEGVNIKEGNSNEIAYQQRVRETPKTTMNDVVSYSWCESDLPAEDNMGKNRMEELHTYAELKHDLRASLPDSFTVCSTILIPKCPNYVWPTFFTILDNNGAQFLAPVCGSGSIESQLKINYLQGSSE